MDKGKTCTSCCKLNESINETGRCETCQARIEKNYIERLRRKYERRKQERLDNPEKFREREKYREANSEKIKANSKEYRKIEIDCEVCRSKVKECRWKAHTETQKHKNNEMIKRKEEEKLSKRTEEEKDEYFMIKTIQKIWNKERV